MSDPATSNVGLYQPSRGSDPGTWDSPVNANTGAADSLASNVAIIPLTNVNVTLSTPPNSGASWSGPYQSQSAVLRFTGALSGHCGVVLPRPGFWIIENLCTGNFLVVPQSIVGGAGQLICAPPNQAIQIYCDGTNVKFVNLPPVGAYLDLGASAVPAWISNCSVPPYLNCDGTTFSAVTYPALASLLGGTTLPDLRGRSRAALNQGTGRITTAGGGIDGNTILAAGGAQTHTLTIAEMPAHNHTDSGHNHTVPIVNGAALAGASGSAVGAGGSTTTSTGFANIQNTGGGGAHSIMNPVAIGGLTLIRAG